MSQLLVAPDAQVGQGYHQRPSHLLRGDLYRRQALTHWQALALFHCHQPRLLR